MGLGWPGQKEGHLTWLDSFLACKE
jgi:hypothetical protein